MNKFTRLLALLTAIVLCMGVSMAAFAESEPTAEPAAEATAEPSAEPAAEATAEPTAAPTADPNETMVTVNGVAITRGEIEAIQQNLVYNYSQYGYDTSDPSFMAVMGRYAVEYATQLEVMKQKGAELGLDQFTDEEKAEIEADNAEQWNNLVDTYVSYYGGVTAESTEEEVAAARVNMLAMLETMGYTEAVMLEDAYENARFEKVEAYMVEGVIITDEDVKALFDKYVTRDETNYANDVAMYEYVTQYYGETSYYIPEGYRGVVHILLNVDEELLGNYQAVSAEWEEAQESANDEVASTTDLEMAVTQSEVDAALQAILDSVQPTIDEINLKLEEGASFADLIVEYGNDPGMEQEPNKSQGYSVHMDSIIWDPAFVKAAFSVENVGDIAAPVVGSYGVHIVQYLRDVPAGPVEYTADVELTLHEEALAERENEQFDATLQGWMASAVITYSADAQAMIDAVPDAE